MRRLRWSAFLLLVLAYVLAFFHRVAPAAIASELQLAFHASGAVLGGLAAMYFYVYTVMQIPTGVLVDTLGVRKIATLGGLVAGLGSILFGLADTLAVASIGRFLVGLGVSVIFIAIMKLNAVWFHDRHFGTVAGFTILLGNLGAVLAASPLVWALSFVSWRSIFVAVGALSLLLGVLTWFLVRNHPGEAGFPSMRELDGEPPHAPHKGHWYDALVRVVKNRATWPGFWPNLGIGGTLFTFAGLWAVPFLRDVHAMSRPLAAAHTSLLLAGFAIGAFLCGMAVRSPRPSPSGDGGCNPALSFMLAAVAGDGAHAAVREPDSVLRHGCRRFRLYPELGDGQGSEPPCPVRHGHQRGEYRQLPRRRPAAASGGLGDGSGLGWQTLRRGARLFCR